MLIVLFFTILSTGDSDILWKDVCTQDDVKNQLWCDISKTIDERAAAFVATLQPSEKIPLLTNEAKGATRLHIPPYQWGSEGLHGPMEPCVTGISKKTGKTTHACPTSFPAPSAMASAYNTTLYWMVGRADGIEARAINNLRNHKTQNNYGDGIDYWSPTINMQRDPRWGRNQEVPGEDPTLTGKYAAAFVHGLQGASGPGGEPAYANNQLLIAACCKHFVANSLESWNGHTRHNFDATVPPQDLADYYFPAFKSCVTEGKVKGIMCSYNAVNGIPMCANPNLLQDTLRNSWGFDGYVTSDCGAVGDVYDKEPAGHGYANNTADAAAISLKAGTDTCCGDWGKHAYLNWLPQAVNESKVKQEDLDRALTRLTKLQMELGLFDPKQDQERFQLGVDHINTPEHRQLAFEAAQQSIVLLKNEQNVLPIKPGSKIAVIGPLFNDSEVFLSNYHGDACLKGFDCVETALAAITKANVGGVTKGVLGCAVNNPKSTDIQSAVDLAKWADHVVLTMGLNQYVEAESKDRMNSTLPSDQPKLVQAVLAVGKPTVLTLIHGGAITLGPLKDQAPSILDCFYGGMMAATAMSSVLFGHYNPTGRLAVTMYPLGFVDQVPLTQMSVTQSPGRTHLYYTGKPEFKFGDGLSFTKWKLSWEQTPPKELHLTASSMPFSVAVHNTGNRSGGVTVLAFWRPVGQHLGALRQRLFDFDGAYLIPGERKILHFDLPVEMLAVANKKGDRILNPGSYEVFFKGAGDLLISPITVIGIRTVVERYLL